MAVAAVATLAATTATQAAKAILANTAGTKEVTNKDRYLKISIVNLDPQVKLVLDADYFHVGRFWSQPFPTIHHNEFLTFHVCNSDTSLIGVSGGVGFGIYDAKTNRRDPDMFVCTFSNPMLGIMKGNCRKAAEIADVWVEMWHGDFIRRDNYGFYKDDDKSLVFIWKSILQHW